MAHVLGSRLRVVVAADPGLPERRAGRIRERLQRALDAAFSVPVTLELRTAMLRLRYDDALDPADAVRFDDEYARADVLLLLTEMPRLTEGRPLIADVHPDQQVAVVSLPSLGVARVGARLVDVLVACAVRMAPESAATGHSQQGITWAQWQVADADTGQLALHSEASSGGLRMVVGMVAGNEPRRTAPQLSSALAAASATGAFGIFYSSIWAMSDYLTTVRLISIGVLAMTVMVWWLVASNRLWDEPGRGGVGKARVVLLYNLSTVLTIALCVLWLYVMLVVLILLGGLIVIDPDYMATVIRGDPTFSSYLDIAWLSAAMGVVAGALGSNFDQQTDLRSLTHGQRERQRRRTVEDEGTAQSGA